ncbi:phosphatidylserine decarboxylase [Candidatus Saccharibacteria bacterium]|nr:phosphatidylserine decarboxylase [Candidatus Saccharibacteria bacterium]
MIKDNSIVFYNRYTKCEEVEKVYGDKFVRFLYQNFFGRILERLFATKFVSIFYGRTQSQKASAKKIPAFVEKYKIPMEDYTAGEVESPDKLKSYSSFNDFFIRKFVDGKRSFPADESVFGAFAEARYYGHTKVDSEVKLPVKGQYLKAKDILNSSKWYSHFEGGPFLIARLCPVDYHRYHYPVSGHTLDSYTIPGAFHSVNPMAIEQVPDIFFKNERRVSILETKDFGKLAYVEVGAVCVGKIVQSFDEKQSFSKGDEKGYFLFGGSTVILLGEPGKWKPSEDILMNTSRGMETYCRLGDEIATQSLV